MLYFVLCHVLFTGSEYYEINEKKYQTRHKEESEIFNINIQKTEWKQLTLKQKIFVQIKGDISVYGEKMAAMAAMAMSVAPPTSKKRGRPRKDAEEPQHKFNGSYDNRVSYDVYKGNVVSNFISISTLVENAGGPSWLYIVSSL